MAEVMKIANETPEVTEAAPLQDELTITPRALEEINNIKKANNLPDDFGLRVGVKGGGCSGFTYTLAFDSQSREGDRVLDKDGVKVYVDSKSLFYLAGITLDFTDGLNGRGFVFNNPNATHTCGCGNSFSV